MKKIILWLLFIISIFFIYLSPVNSASCVFNDKWASINIAEDLGNCFATTNLVKPEWKTLEIKNWFKRSILKWIKNISIFLSIMAVWSIVYWALMLTISVWEEEKIKKWKDIIKWWMIWFLAVISAGWLITIVINLVYNIASK